ncbi:YrdB family protein [Ectobacillus sp. sgz5001026]|uniref:YrdB family protein n=1 Tax=Ectobacillus sp. sgz5001026 TaxID=3242473 RepID=UPI0036D3BC1B
MIAIKAINIAVRFFLELGVLASLGYWGFTIQRGFVMKLVIGIGIPLLVAIIWSIFGAPSASVLLPDPFHLLLELVVFGSGVAALFAVRGLPLAVTFTGLILLNRLLMYIWEQ